jgi:alanine dehydrogenase
MKQAGTLLLNRSVINSLLTLPDYINIVEQAFRLYAEKKTLALGLLHIGARNGEFHIKAGGLQLSKTYFGLKVNGGFFQNAKVFGMPNIQGLIILCDGENGYPLAIMDSIDITVKRTGAITAVAAKYLARPNSRTATICGCGTQGRIQLKYLQQILPLKKVYAYSRDEKESNQFAVEMSEELGIAVTAVPDLKMSVRESDVCVTCTPSREYYLKKDDVASGTFIAAIGADSPDKQELEPELMVSNKIVVDILKQCAEVGELHHAINKGLVSEKDVHAELGDIIAGHKPGRTSDEEIIVFDSTGTALQDVAVASAIYEKAINEGQGTFFNFQRMEQ